MYVQKERTVLFNQTFPFTYPVKNLKTKSTKNLSHKNSTRLFTAYCQ